MRHLLMLVLLSAIMFALGYLLRGGISPIETASKRKEEWQEWARAYDIGTDYLRERNIEASIASISHKNERTTDFVVTFKYQEGRKQQANDPSFIVIYKDGRITSRRVVESQIVP